MTPDQASLLADTRLSREARIVGLYISAFGIQPQEIPHETFRMLLGGAGRGVAKDDTIGGYVKELTTFGWITQNLNTGRGHAPSYEFRPPSQGGPNQRIAPLLRGGLNMDPPPSGGLNTDGPPMSGGLKPPSSSTPPLPPPSARVREDVENSIVAEAMTAMEVSADVLKGCRGSLKDYLAKRVDPRHQHGYVQRLVASMQGRDEFMWRDRRGGTLHEGRPDVLALAFNELAAGDEIGSHFPEPPGGFGNLRSKVRYLVAQRLGMDRDAKSEAGKEQRMTAAQEEADLQAKRERARFHQADEDEKARLSEEGEHQLEQIAEARTWLEVQGDEIKEGVALRLQANLRRLGFRGDPNLAPPIVAGTALLHAVEAVRTREHAET